MIRADKVLRKSSRICLKFKSCLEQLSDPEHAVVGGGISKAVTISLTVRQLIPERISANHYFNKLLQMPLF